MPTISWFYGISIRMFFNDHAPPHFHAYYGGNQALVSIATGQIFRGTLPLKQRRLVEQWALRYNESLMVAWSLASADEPFERIPGLDADND
ncbi:DUF4160 domain-containing protein [Caulobacter sp.]|uniref:DUF4160 domain-containing protein n=1 Tax=Caulobacter sp. TaxID=78 RepID=UPI003BAF58EB